VKHLYLFGLLLSLPFFGSSQVEWNNWYFGLRAAMTFNFGSPPVTLTGSVMNTNGGSSASVSDSSGNLLFYTNGIWGLWNRNNAMMPNGNGLIGGLNAR
jgi:hypothetical protein